MARWIPTKRQKYGVGECAPRRPDLAAAKFAGAARQVGGGLRALPGTLLGSAVLLAGSAFGFQDRGGGGAALEPQIPTLSRADTSKARALSFLGGRSFSITSPQVHPACS